MCPVCDEGISALYGNSEYLHTEITLQNCEIVEAEASIGVARSDSGMHSGRVCSIFLHKAYRFVCDLMFSKDHCNVNS